MLAYMRRCGWWVVAVGVVLLSAAGARAADSALPRPVETHRATGYRGVWYMNQPQGDEYRYKYSGGFATYPQQHVPIAAFSAKANKTFFTYAGKADDSDHLVNMVAFYDHA